MKKITENIKYIKISDFIAPFIFLISLPCALIFRLYNKIKNKKIWLVCENGNTARDNGYWFYKYMREHKKNQICYYVIKKNSKDYEKVKSFGNIIEFKSFKHWIYYLSSQYNISNHKNGNPNQPFFYILHVKLNLFNNRVFLQHGITKDDAEWLYYRNTKFHYFICGAKNEYEFIKQKFGYPKQNVQYTGFARFDNLHHININKKQILIMPTWRNWLGRETNKLGDKINFIKTNFYKNWNEFLNNKELIKFLESNNLEILFYPHIDFQKYLKDFTTTSNNIKFLDTSYDISSALKNSALLVTDYSSVFMDFAYMRKPIIFFQFDKKEYREKQYKEGYFNYEQNIFGVVLENSNEVIKKVVEYYHKDYKIEKEFLTNMDNFFEKNDMNNCRRIYELLRKGE